MEMFRRVSESRNNFADIPEAVHETAAPILSTEAYENSQSHREVMFKLQEAEREAELTNVRYSAKDVLKSISAELGVD